MLKDQKELLSAFNKHDVEYLVIGGHAVSEHSQPRATKDLDVSDALTRRIARPCTGPSQTMALPLSGVTAAEFNNKPDAIFQIGIEPNRVDILQKHSRRHFRAGLETPH
jgi:hypothetical protein